MNILAGFASILGILLAGRQIWLQHFPPANGNECGVSLQYMLQALPTSEVLQKIFAGSAECTQRGWEFLSLNMPEWSLLCFLFFLCLSLFLFMKEIKKI